jgi:3',5'-cyclic AMP phosphodiesterase CpdA
MRLLVLSDLHLELVGVTVPPGLGYDAVILAGDIHSPGRRAVRWARDESVFDTGKPVVIAPGNHEFYGACMPTELAEMRKAAAGSNVHVLSRDALVLDDPCGGQVRILGATLWTDFLLPVLDSGRPTSDVERALWNTNRFVNDFRLIDVECNDVPRGECSGLHLRRRPLTAEDTVAMHRVDRAWLEQQLAEPFVGSTVVVTHHAPCARSVHPKYASDWLSPAFVSDLPAEAFAGVALWVHGHTHMPSDDLQAGARVLSYPRGYRRKDSSFENAAFAQDLVVDGTQREAATSSASEGNAQP